ncbi:immunoglobulin-like domain-containing protein, partial [Haloplasma contractile]
VITGHVDLTFEVGTTAPDWLDGVTATDNSGETITVTVDDSAVDMNTVGTFDITYTAVDSEGNEATETITVTIEDNESPTIAVENQTYKYDSEEPTWADLVTVADNYDVENDITINIDASNVKMDQAGTYDVIVTATDSSGNESTHTFKVTIEEKSNTALITGLIIGTLALAGISSYIKFGKKS